jgi:DNA repair exonuclease SbcCD ATPase subunit
MLKRLTTKNFRKLTDNVFEFGEGLQVVRGANEAGKSTMLEAIAYALAGVKACRDALEEVVTWGQPAKTLKVELVMEFDHVVYTVTRSKSGAEINYEGGQVVGQTECTTFIERLIGVDAGTIARLMMAPQGAIRGALGEKSGKAMELIEQLANFDIIDTVIELIQTHLVTGPTSSAEERVNRAVAAVNVTKEAVQPIDTAATEARLKEHNVELHTLISKVENILKPQVDAAQKRLDEAKSIEQRRALLQQQLKGALATRENFFIQLGQARDEAKTGPHPDEINKVRGQLADAKTATARFTAWQGLQKLNATYPEAYWEGTAEDLQASIDGTARFISGYQKDLAEIDAEIRTLKPQLNESGTKCRGCGQDLPDAAAIEKHNAAIKDKLLTLHARRPGIATQFQKSQEELEALIAVQRTSRPFERVAAELGELGNVDWNYVPPRLTWSGDVPVANVDVSGLQQQLKALEQRAQAAQFAAGRADTLQQQTIECEIGIEKLRAGVAACVNEPLDKVQDAFDTANQAYQTDYGRISEIRYEVEQLRAGLTLAKQEHEQQLLNVKKAEEEQQRAQTDLKALEFNNALLKRVRAARPIIADKLWTIVLAAVSSYFSAMRGTKSVVTRAGNEFRVDGKSISGLSGSTLDLLGLAIRLALTRTFLPNTPFIILDEPAAAMDGDRTESMLGFLVATGFQQTLLVTHDETSETVAQNLITI